MPKPTVLMQLDGDLQASSFDAIVAADCDVDHLLQHSQVTCDQVRSLVHGAIFTRGLKDLHRTAVFVGGSDVSHGEELLREVQAAFFGPLRVSVMFDANGANTTAAAAVLCAAEQLDLSECSVAILAGTGAVGQRVARLLAPRCATVRIGSRSLERAEAVCRQVSEQVACENLAAFDTSSSETVSAGIAESNAIIAAGAAGVRLVGEEAIRVATHLKVAIDLNAVPPLGIDGMEVTDRGIERDGLTCYGAIGVGGTKMKIHKAVIRRLFNSNDQLFDAEEVFGVASELLSR